MNEGKQEGGEQSEHDTKGGCVIDTNGSPGRAGPTKHSPFLRLWVHTMFTGLYFQVVTTYSDFLGSSEIPEVHTLRKTDRCCHEDTVPTRKYGRHCSNLQTFTRVFRLCPLLPNGISLSACIEMHTNLARVG